MGTKMVIISDHANDSNNSNDDYYHDIGNDDYYDKRQY